MLTSLTFLNMLFSIEVTLSSSHSVSSSTQAALFLECLCLLSLLCNTYSELPSHSLDLGTSTLLILLVSALPQTAFPSVLVSNYPNGYFQLKESF